MRLYHTSPEEIDEPHEKGSFGSGIFFASEPYYMTHSLSPQLYALDDLDEDDVIDASSFFYHEDYHKLDDLVKKIMEKLGVDEQTAQDLLDESANLYDIVEDPDDSTAENSWWLQKMALEAAKKLGKKGVRLTDEQGSAWLLDIMHYFDKMKNITNK